MAGSTMIREAKRYTRQSTQSPEPWVGGPASRNRSRGAVPRNGSDERKRKYR